MNRRTFLSLLALPVVAELLQSCGDDSGKNDNGSNSSDAKRSSLKGSAAHVTSGADPTSAAAAVNAFAADLYERLVVADPSANLVFSPASIAIALAMASTGAKGNTLTEMDTVLHITDAVAIHRSMNGLATGLEALNRSRDNTADGGEGTSEVQLSIANSLWGQTGLEFEQAFLDLLSTEYDAGLELVDYKTDPEAARLAINEWVKDETRDRIPNLLPPDSVTIDARLILVNAIYLKANWDRAFSKELTTSEPFTAPSGEVQVDMMHLSRTIGWAGGEGWQAIDLAYVFNELAFTAAIGDTAETVLPSGDEVFAAFESRPVELSFPKFDIETATDLAAVLVEMGMVTPFSTDADFSGMTIDEPLAIGGVIHQANITVDEDSTEAAAATAVLTVAASAPIEQEPVTVVFDRPFTFWLRDTATGTIVFMGRINDPSQTRG